MHACTRLANRCPSRLVAVRDRRLLVSSEAVARPLMARQARVSSRLQHSPPRRQGLPLTDFPYWRPTTRAGPDEQRHLSAQETTARSPDERQVAAHLRLVWRLADTGERACTQSMPCEIAANRLDTEGPGLHSAAAGRGRGLGKLATGVR